MGRKSPPTICRAKMFQDYFSFGEGTLLFQLEIHIHGHYSANEWIKFAQYQKYNLENLNNVISISYESVVMI